MWGGRKGGTVTGPGKVALAEEAGADMVEAREGARSPWSGVEVASEGKEAAEKPRASEEIVIEEISIDGMCGVY